MIKIKKKKTYSFDLSHDMAPYKCKKKSNENPKTKFIRKKSQYFWKIEKDI